MKTFRDYPIKSVTIDDPLFPISLKSINTCPRKIYYRGKLDHSITRSTLSIVGSRRATKYAHTIINSFMPSLVRANITIISGFMYGVDTIAHEQCLEYQGRTIAVLGSGLDHLYPPENDKLYTKILENNGLVISEYEPDFKPTLWTFPQRNRIVAALSTIGVFVVEAGIKSGSLITANLAFKQGKDVYALPGPITSSSSSGTNYLIKNNMAKLVTGIEDLIPTTPEQKTLFKSSSDPKYQKIFELLASEPLSIDELALYLNTDICTLSIQLTSLTLDNLLEENGGKFYLVSKS